MLNDFILNVTQQIFTIKTNGGKKSNDFRYKGQYATGTLVD